MIELVGSDTVVAVITDSTASCKAAGQLVEAKYPGHLDALLRPLPGPGPGGHLQAPMGNIYLSRYN